ncbi:MAG TPA: lysophospholipid acyltransferase family protein [Verrucomicrobiae bacterium]|nr:lysophospholipid acyltransferase family protein [Verrucomicrobiae bacterium]
MAKKKFYRYPLYLVARGLAALLALIPRPVLLPLARMAGRAAYAAVARQREKTLENLRFAFGKEKSEAEIRGMARKVFENLSETCADVLQLNRLTPEGFAAIVDTREAEVLYRRILEGGRGLISLTAHIGNWELLAAAMAARGFQGAVLGRRIYFEPYNRWISGLRASAGVETIYRDDPPKKVLKLLRENKIIGILADQDIDSLKSIFVEFLGRPAYTIIAPAKLSQATGAPILPNFLVREGGKYRLIVGEPIRPETWGQDEAVEMITRAWMRECEKVIRAYPEQWAWMHNRWKTRPATEAGGETGDSGARPEMFRQKDSVL